MNHLLSENERCETSTDMLEKVARDSVKMFSLALLYKMFDGNTQQFQRAIK